MRVFVVLNPVAGRTKADRVEKVLRRYFTKEAGWTLEIYETTGREDVSKLVRQKLDQGTQAVFAAGGDGTVSAVVDGLAHTDIPLGIIPTGTGNVLAQELGIPLNIEKACQLLTKGPDLRAIDSLYHSGRYYILSVGTGIDAQAIEAVNQKHKRRFGFLAYVASVLKVIAGIQPNTFTIIADGKTRRFHAADVLLANVSTLTGPIRWGEHIRPDDGRIDICIMRARNIIDLMDVIVNTLIPGLGRKERGLHYLPAYHSVLITTEKPLRIQGDGDLLGLTPLEVMIEPSSIKVFVPHKTQSPSRFSLPMLGSVRSTE